MLLEGHGDENRMQAEGRNEGTLGGPSQKPKVSEAREMAHQVAACSDLAEDLGLVPSTYFRELTTACHLSSRGSDAFSGTCTCVHIQLPSPPTENSLF